MASTTIGAKAKNYDFDISDVDLKSFMKTDYDMHFGNTLVTLKENNKNYVELHGSFSLKGMIGGDFADGVKHIYSIKVVENGTVSYTVSGLDITGKDLDTSAKFAAYISSESYNISGNGTDNVIKAAAHADQIHGSGGADKIYGLDGQDKLYGDSGNDALIGGNQADRLDGGAGNDKLVGGSGADLLSGGDQVDRLDGGAGSDKLIGGAGADLFIFVRGSGTDTISDFDATGKVHDDIDLSSYKGIDRFSDLDITSHKHDVIIELKNHDEIVLKNVNIHDLDRGDFNF
jgi:Ca2+-binding RTX toxin-like protein